MYPLIFWNGIPDWLFTENVLENGMVDANEEKLLLEIFTQFTHPEKVSCAEIELGGKVCCLTGSFNNGAKSDVEAAIMKKGGTCVAGLNKNVDYLIVGG
ncbi:MAG: BRCT domain-containing protein [Mobilitalea sp.]